MTVVGAGVGAGLGSGVGAGTGDGVGGFNGVGGSNGAAAAAFELGVSFFLISFLKSGIILYLKKIKSQKKQKYAK